MARTRSILTDVSAGISELKKKSYPKFVGFVLKTRKKVLFGALLLFQISVITHHRFSDS
ncbi:hypothetical protein [Candidatus Electrothrix sp.]|uniref:hypothetical protein n=1 Tax=Candidatus Electrothrix sp. TaxID=2170559 RepID=UPI004057B36F